MLDREQHLSHQEASGDTPGTEQSLLLPYLLGELPLAEEERFEAKLYAGSPDAQELEESMDALTLLAEEIAGAMPAPRRSLRDRVMGAIAGSSEEAAASALSYDVLVREREGEWVEEPGAPGISVKLLFEDKGNSYYTVLVRIGAGVHYPAHRHVGREQCFVISGDLHVNDLVLHGGDYITSEDGTEHHLTYSERGCMLLLTTKLSDEILA